MDIKTLIRKISEIIDESYTQKNSYFRFPMQSASSRRWYEKRHSHDKVEWVEGGHSYSAEYSVSCSCRNIYAKGYYYRDGIKTTLTTIKNSLKRLQSMVNNEEGIENA